MKLQRGRPPIPPGDRKEKRIEVRTDSADKQLLEQAALSAGMKLSDWIRVQLQLAARRELRRRGHEP